VANAGLNGWLMSAGYLAVALFVGIESLGVPFPGETMLIAAAVFAATGHLSIAGVIVAAIIGAVVGDNIGFGIGWFGGYPILRRYGKYVRLDQAKLKVGRYIFMRHGAKVVFVGRFVSVLRTYAAFLAGTNHMRWVRFLVANAAGAIVWATLYGVGAYLASATIAKLNTPVAIGLGALAVVVIVLAAFFVRANIRRLEAVAEAALPGPLEGFEKKDGSRPQGVPPPQRLPPSQEEPAPDEPTPGG
jgi:membrane protein DedA with SNARE-associated domain